MSDSSPSNPPASNPPGDAVGVQSADGSSAAPPAPPEVAAAAAQAGGKISKNFGRYRLSECIGRGGMGAVFKAHDKQLDRTVALKIPFLGKDDDSARQRFYREARAAALIHHPNVCPVYDVGEFNNLPYLTMAFIQGRSIGQMIEGGQVFAPVQAAGIVRKIALAMHEAHAVGIVHRDLKPSNVLMTAANEPVVMDFGLARREDDKKSEGLTRQGDILGTLEYMSPEQVEGETNGVGPPSDIFSLGVVLYEMLTGKRPFTGTTTSKMTAILLKEADPPSSLRTGVPPALDAIVAKAMAKKPADRYPTMAAFAQALTEFLRAPAGRPAAGPPASAVTTPPPAPVPTPPSAPASRAVPRVVEDPPAAPNQQIETPSPTSTPTARVKKKAKKKPPKKSTLPWVLAGVGGLVLVGVIITVVVLATSGGKPPIAQSPATGGGGPPPPPVPPDRGGPPDRGQPDRSSPNAPGADNRPPEPRGPNPPKPPGPLPPAELPVVLDAGTDPLPVGGERKVKVRVERKGYGGAARLQVAGPKQVVITPSEVTIPGGNSDPTVTLTVQLTAAPPTSEVALDVTLTPERESKRPPTKANASVPIAAGPCQQAIFITERGGDTFGPVAFTPDAALAIVGFTAKPGATEPPPGQQSGNQPPGNPPEPPKPGEPGSGGNQPKPGDPPKLDPKNLRAINLQTGELIRPLAGQNARAAALHTIADGKIVAAVGADGRLAFWDLASGKLQIQTDPLKVLAFAAAPDAKRFVVVVPGGILRFNEKLALAGPAITMASVVGKGAAEDALNVVAVNADKKAVVGGVDGKLFLLDLDGKHKAKPLAGPTEAVLCATFAPKGTLAATGGGGAMKVGTLQPGQEHAVYLWDVAAATAKWHTPSIDQPVAAIAFSADGRYLASGGTGGEVRVWNVEDGKQVAKLDGHTGRILDLVFSPDGTALWTASADRTLRRWKVE